MRQILLVMTAMLMACCSKESETVARDNIEAGKTLVVYYSYTGDSKKIAETLTSRIEADVMRIQPNRICNRHTAAQRHQGRSGRCRQLSRNR